MNLDLNENDIKSKNFKTSYLSVITVPDHEYDDLQNIKFCSEIFNTS